MPTQQRRNGDMTDLLSTDFLRNNNPAVMLGLYDSMVKGLPGLIGYWPGNMTDSNGRLMDDGPNALHMTNNNTAVLQRAGLRTYWDYNGTNQYHSVADTANLDIIGTEAHITNKGLTLGAWINLDAAAGNGIITKWNSATGNRSYALTAAGVFQVSNTGASATSLVTATNAPTTDTWVFVAGRYTPSTEMAVWVNGEKTTNTTSITASIFNSSAVLAVGAFGNPTAYTNGRICRAFVCSNAVLDDFLFTLYQYGRYLFGV